MADDTNQQSLTQISGSEASADDAPLREAILYPDDQPQEATDALPQHQRAAAQPDKPAPDKRDASEYELRMPAGVELDSELFNSAVPLLRDAGVSSDQAEKLLPFVTQVQERYHRSNLDQLSALTKSWAEEAKADPVIGGRNWKETGRLASVALKAGGAADSVREAQQLLNESGLGNHPAFIRLFRNMGAEIERLRCQKGGSMKYETSIEAARRHHQQAVYPNDPPRQASTMRQSGAPRSRVETSYPDDQPRG